MDEVGLNNYLQSLKENLVFKNFHNNIINSQELTIEQINKNLFSANNIEEFKLVSLKDIVLSGYNLQTDHLNYIDELREKMSKRVESYSRGREDETDKGSSPPPPGRARRSPTMKKTARATVAGATAARATTEGSPTARATVARTQPASPDPTDEPAPQLPPGTPEIDSSEVSVEVDPQLLRQFEAGSPTARATVARTQPASPDPTDEPAPQLPPGTPEIDSSEVSVEVDPQLLRQFEARSPTARATVARTQPASPDPTDEPAPQLPPPGGHASRVRKSAARATTEKDPTDDIRKSEEALRERRERRKMKLKAETLDRRSDGVMAVHREAKRQTERLLQEGRENYHGS